MARMRTISRPGRDIVQVGFLSFESAFTHTHTRTHARTEDQGVETRIRLFDLVVLRKIAREMGDRFRAE